MSEIIQMIMRQTNYNENEAQEKLNMHNNDAIKVIEEYMGITPTKNEPIKSVNQEKYKQFMDVFTKPKSPKKAKF